VAVILLPLVLSALLVACTQAVPRAAPGGKLTVLATTTIVGDVVHQVAGDLITLEVLLSPGMDDHAFEPTPQDAAKLAGADLVFANGAGLETFLAPLLQDVGTQVQTVYVSDGITLRKPDGTPEPGNAAGDPHTWTDPTNVITWTHNIEAALAAADPTHAADYRTNAEAYRGKLTELDQWVRAQVALIPPQNRKLVTDHAVFGYLAQRYGLEQIGTVVPGYSTLAQPSARDLAALESAISSYGVKAIFVGNTVNDSLARRVAQDTGIQLVHLYTESLSDPQGPVSNYLDFMRYDASMIVQALR
jgi:manganese/iron transport system substrate-binding protein